VAKYKFKNLVFKKNNACELIFYLQYIINLLNLLKIQQKQNLEILLFQLLLIQKLVQRKK
jgi:hypothetical protein